LVDREIVIQLQAEEIDFSPSEAPRPPLDLEQASYAMSSGIFFRGVKAAWA